MADPWADAAAVLFQMPGSTDAIYSSPQSDRVPCRAIISQTPVDLIVGDRQIEAGSTLIQLQRADFGGTQIAPEKGGTIEADGETFEVLARPRLDVERTAWTCEAADIAC